MNYAALAAVLISAPAFGAVVYTDLRAGIDLGFFQGRTLFLIDLDRDGVDDFRIRSSTDCPAGCGVSVRRVRTGSRDGVAMAVNSPLFARAYADGEAIAFEAEFSEIGYACYSHIPSLTWDVSAEPLSVGVRLALPDGDHAGWIRLQRVSANCFNSHFRVLGFAYETEPGVHIVAGVIPCPADFDGDGELDADDLSDFITAFFEPAPPSLTDFNRDGSINPDDLSDFVAAYFAAC